MTGGLELVASKQTNPRGLHMILLVGEMGLAVKI